MRWIAPALLILILALATGLRLRGVHFGLPALNDPDEPLFMMTAFDMLRNRSLNPGWFGHPGTITLYCLALICLAVGVFGVLTGRTNLPAPSMPIPRSCSCLPVCLLSCAE